MVRNQKGRIEALEAAHGVSEPACPYHLAEQCFALVAHLAPQFEDNRKVSPDLTADDVALLEKTFWRHFIDEQGRMLGVRDIDGMTTSELSALLWLAEEYRRRRCFGGVSHEYIA